MNNGRVQQLQELSGVDLDLVTGGRLPAAEMDSEPVDPVTNPGWTPSGSTPR